MPALVAIRPGDVVRLVVTWGKESRMQCAVCVRYMKGGPRPICTKCGSVYEEIAEGYYEVVEVHARR